MTDSKKESSEESIMFNFFIRIIVGRVRGSSQIRILDTATRARRQKRQLEALEKDNFQEDPHAAFAHLVKAVKLPSFHDGTECKCKYLYV